MVFNEKLQKLRKEQNLTQEELAEKLFVSRTAISKWESGRGYPSIDSLKVIAKYFHITIDELIGNEEIISLAEQDKKENNKKYSALICGILDCLITLLIFLPIFGDGGEAAVTMFAITNISSWLKIAFILVTCLTVLNCCLWYSDKADYAYVEPVCTVPSYRGKGIAKAVIYEALNRARALGAKKAYVISDTKFYKKLGFEKEYRFSFYWKKPLTVNGTEYHIFNLLGKGKGGYSYLARRDGRQYVVKQIHHEPCDYYTFGNKIEAERNDYERLKNADIRIPEMLDIDIENERIVKEYIDGDTIFDLVKNGESVEIFLPQVKEMADLAKAAGLNIDYFPTNFVVQDGLLWYIDYECNKYMEEWSFENWGVKYWSRTPEFEEYLRNH